MLALIGIIICVIVSVIAFLVVLLDPDKDTKAVAKWVVGIPLVVIALIFFAASIIVIPNGHAGVMVRFQKTTGVIYENGMHREK